MACWPVAVYPFPVVLVPVAEVVKSPVQLALKQTKPPVAEAEVKMTQVASKNTQKKPQMKQRQRRMKTPQAKMIQMRRKNHIRVAEAVDY